MARHRRPVHPARPEPAHRRRPPPPDRARPALLPRPLRPRARPSATTSTASATPRACPTSSRSHGYTAYVFRRPEEHQVSLPANTFLWQGAGGAEVARLPHRPRLRRQLRRPRRPGPRGRRRRRSRPRPHHVLLRRRQPRRRPVQGDDRMDPRQPRLRRPRADLLHPASLLRGDRRQARPPAAASPPSCSTASPAATA